MELHGLYRDIFTYFIAAIDSDSSDGSGRRN
jgi:hypothetical protein